MRSRASLLPLLLAVGCSEEQLPVVESEHLRFHGELDGACDALGRMYERELARIETALGRELLEPVDVHVGEAAIEQWCSTRFPGDRLPGGCAPSGTLLAASLSSLSHELVHAIRLQHDAHGVPLIEEGLATMYGSSRPYVPEIASVDASDPDSAPIPRLEHDRNEVTYADRSIGAHFLHWVGESYGRDPLLELIWSDGFREADPTAIQASFAEVIDETMLAAQDRWSNESEHETYFSDLCYGFDTAPLPPGGLLVEGPACCADPSAEQGSPPWLDLGRRCFTLSAATDLQIELISGDGMLILRSDYCDSTIVSLGPGESETITASACRWKVVFAGPEHCEEPVAFRYAVTPL
jgi:hypothetical protein